jgi:hypothetical protein
LSSRRIDVVEEADAIIYGKKLVPPLKIRAHRACGFLRYAKWGQGAREAVKFQVCGMNTRPRRTTFAQMSGSRRESEPDKKIREPIERGFAVESRAFFNLSYGNLALKVLVSIVIPRTVT